MNAEDKKANDDQIRNEKAEHARASDSGGSSPEGGAAKRESSETQNSQEAPSGRQTPVDEAEKIKADLEHSSAVNRSLLIFFLLAMTYFLVIVASTTDLQLLLPNSTIKLPILNVDLDLIKFYLFSPFILIVIHYNFLFSLCQHTKKLCRLRMLEPDNDDPLPHSSFLINLLIKPKKIRARQAVGGNGPKDNRVPYYLIRCLLWIVIYLYPLFILVLFQWRFADYHDLWKTIVHLFYLALDISLLSFFWIRISDPLFESHPLRIFEKYAQKPQPNGPNTKPRKRKRVCDKERARLDKLIFFFPCLLGSLLFYLKKNTGAVNFVVIALLVLIQFRVIGILLFLDYLPPGKSYRIVHNYKYLAVPRLKIVDTPIVARYRQSASTGEDNFVSEDLSQSIPPEPSCFQGREESGSSSQKLDLSGRDLRFAILDGSDLTGVVLKDAKLQGSSLMNVRLDRAEISKARLQGANLKRARLWFARLNEANLEEAILESAQLQCADLIRATLDGADMTWLRMDGAYLSRVSLVGAILYKARLPGAFAEWADFRGADLNSADLTESHLRGADFYAADLRFAQLQGSDLVDANLQTANLESAKLNSADLLGANLYATNLKKVDFTDTILTGTNLSYAYIEGTTLIPDQIIGKAVTLLGLNIHKTEIERMQKIKTTSFEDLINFGAKVITPREGFEEFLTNLPIQEFNYQMRLNIVCDSVYAAKGVVHQLLYEKELEHQLRALFNHLRQNCPVIAGAVVPE